MEHCEVVGVSEIAERLGMRKDTLAMLRWRGRFPVEPIGTVSGNPAFSWPEVEDWARATGRLA